MKQRVFPLIHRRIKQLDMGYGDIADRIGMPATTFSQKMSGKIPWRETELQLLADELLQPDEGMSALIQRRRI